MNPDPDAPMDTQLLQLERELFSLSPVEMPRPLASQIDRQVLGPVGIGRQAVASGRMVPFQWRRMVVPAAAAVVVVSVLHHLDQPAGRSAGAMAMSNSAAPALGAVDVSAARAPISLTSGYVLRAEPIYISPGTWQGVEPQYFFQPGSASGSGYNVPQRTPGLAPVVFH